MRGEGRYDRIDKDRGKGEMSWRLHSFRLRATCLAISRSESPLNPELGHYDITVEFREVCMLCVF